MSDPVILALIALVPALIVGAPASIIAWASYKQALKIDAKAEMNAIQQIAAANQQAIAAKLAEKEAAKTDVIVEKATVIEHLTNSTNSNLQKALELMTEKYQGLERRYAQLEQEKKDTAASRVVTDMQTASALHATAPVATSEATPVVAAAEKILTSIDRNTEATAANTKKTGVDIQELKKDLG